MSETTEAAAPENDLTASTLEIQIEPAVKVRTASYDLMTLKEPTGQQVRQAETMLKDGLNVYTLRRYQIQLIINVSGWPQDAVEALPISTIDRAGRFLARFTNLGQVTGAT